MSDIMHANNPTSDFIASHATESHIACVHCGATSEYIEIIATDMGISNPICCDDSEWHRYIVSSVS